MPNKTKIKILVAFVVVALLAILINYILSEVISIQGNFIKRMTVRGILVKAELVSSSEKMEQGLSGRTKLPVGRGMLFQMLEDDVQHFWMKGMLIPIDIIWIENGRVIGCEKNIQPGDPRIFSSPSDAGYVLEVPEGFCDTNKIQLNDEVKIF